LSCNVQDSGSEKVTRNSLLSQADSRDKNYQKTHAVSSSVSLIIIDNFRTFYFESSPITPTSKESRLLLHFDDKHKLFEVRGPDVPKGLN
jgi:hypothetical protein